MDEQNRISIPSSVLQEHFKKDDDNVGIFLERSNNGGFILLSNNELLMDEYLLSRIPSDACLSLQIRRIFYREYGNEQISFADARVGQLLYDLMKSQAFDVAACCTSSWAELPSDRIITANDVFKYNRMNPILVVPGLIYYRLYEGNAVFSLKVTLGESLKDSFASTKLKNIAFCLITSHNELPLDHIISLTSLQEFNQQNPILVFLKNTKVRSTVIVKFDAQNPTNAPDPTPISLSLEMIADASYPPEVIVQSITAELRGKIDNLKEYHLVIDHPAGMIEFRTFMAGLTVILKENRIELETPPITA